MTEFMAIDVALLLLVVLAAVAVIEVRNLFSAVLLSGIYSLLMALVWVNMDAVDVAFTEAAVGAGISTILLVGTLVLVGDREVVRKAINWPALLAVLLTAGALVYGTLDMPRFGSPDSPANRSELARRFIEQSVQKDPSGKSGQEALLAAEVHEEAGTPDHAHEDYFHGHVPNQVTAVIVTYRALDTMFEVAVIFTAGLGMMLLLRGRKGNPLKGGLL
jgi:multicomponent Na+:H+ antiporter subunit B